MHTHFKAGDLILHNIYGVGVVIDSKTNPDPQEICYVIFGRDTRYIVVFASMMKKITREEANAYLL